MQAVWLVSKEYAACAVEFLFRKSYISKQTEDLDAFDQYTNHPIIRKRVSTFEYDAVGFTIDFTEAR